MLTILRLKSPLYLLFLVRLGVYTVNLEFIRLLFLQTRLIGKLTVFLNLQGHTEYSVTLKQKGGSTELT